MGTMFSNANLAIYFKTLEIYLLFYSYFTFEGIFPKKIIRNVTKIYKVLFRRRTTLVLNNCWGVVWH